MLEGVPCLFAEYTETGQYTQVELTPLRRLRNDPMQLSFRWYGPLDPIPLGYIRQIPGVVGIVTAL